MKKIFVITVLVLSLLLTVSCGKPVDTQDKILYESTGSSAIEIGTGDNYFDFAVTDTEGTVYNFHIHTNKTIVGEALEELGMIEGSEGDFGIYVNKVNGIYAEYDVTGTYWAFYVNGEYASEGIDMTKIVQGETYEMRIER
ncbi:MAG: DUF4430 domain-containing protein [Clostridia bacterium]|nr:DUF4430 domain-containing protein [Clostridia bacterium]